MTKRFFFITLPVCVLIALSAAFLFVSPAFAQDEVPPEVAPTEAPVEVLPTEAAPVEVVPTEVTHEEVIPPEPAPVELAPIEEPPAKVAPVEDVPVAEPSLAEQLNDSGVAIADSTGTKLSLATNSTQGLLTGGDPYFVVGSIKYSFLRSGGSATCPPDSATSKCVYSPTPIQAALDSMVTYGTPTDRKLYIEADTYTENVFVNGSLPGVKGLTTIQGMDAFGKLADPSTVVINGRLEIQNFLSGFSVKNLTVINSTDTASAAIWAKNNGGTITLTDVTAQATQQDSSGIIIDGSGAELTRVTSDDNAYHGLYIPKTNGIPVKITNSTFDRNLKNVKDGIPEYDTVYGCGDPAFPNCTKPIAHPFYVSLEIHRYVRGREAVMLNGVSVSDNNGTGAAIQIYANSVTVKNSVFNNNSSTTSGLGNGLDIYGQNILITNVDASGNCWNGIEHYGGTGTTFNAAGLTVDGNGRDGLFIQTGRWVETPIGSGNWEITPIGAGPITLKGINASRNGMEGLSVTTDGTFSLFDAYISENGSDNDSSGVYVFNRYSKTMPLVTITNIEVAKNSISGIELYTKGPVIIKNFKVYQNEFDGILIDACIDFDYDAQYCNAWGNGAVILTNDYGIFNETHNNQGAGIEIMTGGAVTITNTDSFGNGYVGGVIDNSVGTLTSPVTINVNAPANYYDSFSNNGSEGMLITSHGVVTISKIWSQGNGYSGVFIDNEPWYLNAGIPVTVSDSVFDGNSGKGLDLYSKGQITLTNIRANNNSWDGLYLDNSGGTVGITINAGPGKGNEFQGNKGKGLVIFSDGSVSLTNLYAANNDSGVYINNASAGKRAVSLKQVGAWKIDGNFINGNVFSINKNNGLEIHSNGAVTVGFFQATGNGGDGINIDASGGNGAVMVTGAANSWDNLSYNSGDGVNVIAKGLITMVNLQANGNGENGTNLNNKILGATGGVIVKATAGRGNEFQWNKSNGLWIESNGFVTLTNIFASNNCDPIDYFSWGGSGVYIDNSTGTGAVTIKQTGSWGGNGYWTEGNAFNDNRGRGLYINTLGAVSIAFYQTKHNHALGIDIFDFGTGSVTVSGMPKGGDNIGLNECDGLRVESNGNIIVSNLNSSENGCAGANLKSATGSIILTNANFDRNAFYGVIASAAGTISWKNGSASKNYSGGASFTNSQGKPITITNITTSCNGETGLSINNNGVVTVTNSQSDTNSINNHWIDNGQWWEDNLSDNQVWLYQGLKDVKATFLVDSSRFTPIISVTDSNGNNVSLSSDVAGEWYFTSSDDNIIYQIHVEAVDHWNGNGYEIKLYEGDEEPDWGTTPSELPAYGMHIDNSDGTNAGVTITNTGNRWNSNNSGTDVYILSSGAVTLKGMDLNDSGAGGLYINNVPLTGTSTPGVTLTNVNFYADDGGVVSILEGGSPIDKLMTAYIATRGPVTVKTSNMNSHFGYGYYVDNTYGTALSPITFTDVSVDGGWGQYLLVENSGIILRSRGAVTLINTSSNYSGGNGIDIDTMGAVTFSGGVSAFSNTGRGVLVVTLGAFTLNIPPSGTNYFSNNGITGLKVEAGGKITLNRIMANDNGQRDGDGNPITSANGIYIISTNSTGASPAVLTEVTANHNTYTGVEVDTKGAVTLTNIQANDNRYYGLYVDQIDASDSLKPIILNKITASNNGLDGIHVDSIGSITTNGIRTNYNEHSGMVLDNANTNSTGTITMLNTLGQNMTILNGQTCVSDVCTPNIGAAGVKLISNGAIIVNQLESDFNYGQGLWVDNSSSIAPIKPVVTLNSVITRSNYYNGSGIGVINREDWGHGIVVKSSGVITINNSWSVSNQGDGLRITTNANVFINNSSFIWNNNAGIWTADTTGTPTIKLNGTTWFGNLRHFPDPGLDVPLDDRNLWRGTGWLLAVS